MPYLANRDMEHFSLDVFGGIPYQTHANISGSTGQYCQLIHRQDRFSVYQPSNEAAMFCESSEFIA
jgi:hypothetical protein